MAGILLTMVLTTPTTARSAAQNITQAHAVGKGGGTRIKSPSQAQSDQIQYHGGPIILGTSHLYYIWYGNWSGNSATSILTDFAKNVGSSPWFNINTTYSNSSGENVINAVTFGGAMTDNYTRGKSLSDADVLQVVTAQQPTDTNGIYVVLTSGDVDETSGFGTSYCGWHNHATINGRDIKYAFVGSPDRFSSACEAQTSSPNGNAAADAMVSVIAHEVSESVTDPDLNAWYDAAGEENADKCAWTFGSTYQASNGSLANVHLGRDFLFNRTGLMKVAAIARFNSFQRLYCILARLSAKQMHPI